jgi:membrane-bound lytic murein transglycosylase B
MTRKIATLILSFLAAGSIGLAWAVPARADEPSGCADAAKPSFDTWLENFRKQAAQAGISRATLDANLSGLQPDPKILEYDQRQPEFVQTFWNYLDARVTGKRIAAGQALLAQNADLFAAAEQRYGVPARYLAALWGQETNYGDYLGNTAIVPALATLAYDDRRSAFFRAQLLDALRIIDSGNMSADDLRGSWAGAFGHMQFMPSTFLRYAVDGDGDGRINIRTSIADAIDSSANYLQRSGWLRDEDWGREVLLPKDFDFGQARLDRWKTIRDWSDLGITLVDGSPLPKSSEKAAILLPQGHDGPAILVQHNFNVILRWNRSVNYALAVAELADLLDGRPAFSTGRGADNRRLSHEQAIDLQQSLTILGFDPGPPDGRPGSRTLNAIRAYQASASLPADGYPSLALLDKLHATLREKSLPLPDDTQPTPASENTGADKDKT